MKYYIGVTDNTWYSFLAQKNRDDVNFWQPGGNKVFRALPPGGPFLFKLKSPVNAIGGLGFFSSHTFLPLSMAWEVFGEGNGSSTLSQLSRMISDYRNDGLGNPTIGCIVLTNPIFFDKSDWIGIPENWSRNIMQGKAYSTQDRIGAELWSKVENLLQNYLPVAPEKKTSQLIVEEEAAGYGNPFLTRIRLGQSAFRMLVTDAYNRRCTISGEKTLPVLEAAHIKSYAESGPHVVSNSLLLRSDLHRLFDAGYLTITTDLKVEISKRIKEEFENGREYYKFHGNNISNLPNRGLDLPARNYVLWHNENVYLD